MGDSWEAFESTIHSYKNLHSVDKFNYLKGQLQRTASEILFGLVNLTKEKLNIATEREIWEETGYD